jgi:hypothetical protein
MSSSFQQILSPRPPPPAEAFNITGKPISRAVFKAVATSLRASDPGITGIPRAFILFLAPILRPMSFIARGDGPIKVMPASAQVLAKSAFSDRKPYPGCMASAPTCFARSTIA